MTVKTKILANKRNFFLFLVLIITFQVHAQTGLGLKTIVIDPGHGGKDPGAIGKKLKTMEKTVVLNVSLLIKNGGIVSTVA